MSLRARRSRPHGSASASNLTDDLSLVYSTDLVNSSDQVWIAEYDVTRQFVTRTVRQSDGSFRFDFRHEVRFGGIPDQRRTKRTQQIIRSVSVSGSAPESEEDVRKAFKLKVGDSTTSSKCARLCGA